MQRLTIDIRADEKLALYSLAFEQRRNLEQQAAVLLREKLIEMGKLENEPSKPKIQAPAASR